EVGYAIPKEGAQMFFDQLAIPKDAEHVAEAHAFIDYLLRPDVAARTSSVVSYANGNLASQPLIDKAVLDDKSIYPVPATMARLYTNKARDAKT
ncbi:spermidine/putrescine ABC transporter substrate-binding protein PotF, partial [Rhodoblastus acidophilus]